MSKILSKLVVVILIISLVLPFTTFAETTHYVNKYYDVTYHDDGSVTKNKHIYGPNGELIATIEDKGEGPSTYFVHTDHLGGTNVVTDESGEVVEVTDYLPFGKINTSVTNGSFSEARKYTGHVYDEDADLNYMNARYQDGNIGRFLSQDPAFQVVGSGKLKDKTGLDLETYLSDPQNFNSYSYARNNPLKHVDESGEFVQLAPALIVVASFVAVNAHLIPAFIDNYQSVLNFAPGTGDAIALKEAYTGESSFTGNKLNSGERALAGVSALPLLGIVGDFGRISVSQNRIQHVIDRHTLTGSKFVEGKTSYFNDGINIQSLIEKASDYTGQTTKNGFIERVIDAGKNIGVDRSSGKQTSIYTVITDIKNKFITSHPGKPGKPYKLK